uniref:Uncharacterized protein n=1 Tax=Rhizophora mucronata TaxID=61149 RepID=A0A2P2Q894_RHIMU
MKNITKQFFNFKSTSTYRNKGKSHYQR